MMANTIPLSQSSIRQAVWMVVSAHRDILAEAFYEAFLQDAEADRYLRHEEVHVRLRKSLGSWLGALFDVNSEYIQENEQKRIGALHARIGVPIHLVLKGASFLKERIASFLIKQVTDHALLVSALLFMGSRIDAAMIIMSEASVLGTERQARISEAYRMVSLGHDIATEKEAQRAALLEWARSYLIGVIAGSPLPSSIEYSPFGLWLRHRARVLFDGAPDLEALIGVVRNIEELVAEGISDHSSLSEIASAVTKGVDEAQFLLGGIFEYLIGLEAGRDPLTKTLNRRFLPGLLVKQIEIAQAEERPLSLVILDIDYFKILNDEYGHSSGDAVLRQVVARLEDNIRPYDFLFRYGGEEFLILLPDATQSAARDIADRLRKCIADRPFRVFDQSEVAVTISLGVATYDGHPDYEYFINAADQALYRAKKNGRDTVGLASGNTVE